MTMKKEQPTTLQQFEELIERAKRFRRVKDAIPGSEVVSFLILGHAATLALKSIIEISEAAAISHVSSVLPPR